MNQQTIDQQHMEIFDVLSEKYSAGLPDREHLTEWISTYGYDQVLATCQAACNTAGVNRVGGWISTSLKRGWQHQGNFDTTTKKGKEKSNLGVNSHPVWLTKFFTRLREDKVININRSATQDSPDVKPLAIVANEDDIGFMLLNLPMYEEEYKDEETLLRLFWLMVEAARSTQGHPVELYVIRAFRPYFDEYEDTFLGLFRPDFADKRKAIRGIFEEGLKEGLSGKEIFKQNYGSYLNVNKTLNDSSELASAAKVD
tara:strand:+ start:87 stop:854 length:768 start_codon:yes stop_codon:yes gene_type:complete